MILNVPFNYVSPFSDLSLYYRYTPGVSSPLATDDPIQRVRQQSLISRFNDLFAQDRLTTMDTLRRYSDDHENNQRICFAIMQVCDRELEIWYSYKSKCSSMSLQAFLMLLNRRFESMIFFPKFLAVSMFSSFHVFQHQASFLSLSSQAPW